jgi:hypothetical protein
VNVTAYLFFQAAVAATLLIILENIGVFSATTFSIDYSQIVTILTSFLFLVLMLLVIFSFNSI